MGNIADVGACLMDGHLFRFLVSQVIRNGNLVSPVAFVSALE